MLLTHPWLRHPRTGQPLTALGVTKRGHIIWPQLGGSPDDPSDSKGDGGDGTPGDGAGDNASNADKGKGPTFDGDFDADRAKRAIQAARDAEKKAKDEAKAERERLAAILKAAGLTPDGQADPEAALKEAAAKAEAAAEKARTTAVELAVYKHADKVGVDPGAALDSRTFLKQVSELDPDAADFGDRIEAALKAALNANNKLAAATTQGGGRQGADHTGGTNGHQRPTSIGAAVAAAFRR